MKKIIAVLSVIIVANTFSAHSFSLNNKLVRSFSTREIKNMTFGKYNVDTELVTISMEKAKVADANTKLETVMRDRMRKLIKDYSKEVLGNYLSGSLLTGPGFDNKKMTEFADEISKRLVNDVEEKGRWKTEKGDIVAVHTIEKDTVKTFTTKVFNERLKQVVDKLSEYKETFDQIKSPTE